MSNSQSTHESVDGVAADHAQSSEILRTLTFGGSGETCDAHSVNAVVSDNTPSTKPTASKEGDDEDKKDEVK
ncbi:hypothetical protein NMY22_g13199 [Coprinellus aureogranulatus]|nr:hypothetical protein NMY22_g13199 [Coprinellus aureogranulatus]